MSIKSHTLNQLNSLIPFIRVEKLHEAKPDIFTVRKNRTLEMHMLSNLSASEGKGIHERITVKCCHFWVQDFPGTPHLYAQSYTIATTTYL